MLLLMLHKAASLLTCIITEITSAFIVKSCRSAETCHSLLDGNTKSKNNPIY